MNSVAATVSDRVNRAVQSVTPLAYRMRRSGRNLLRRALRKPRSVGEGPNLLPLLIQVLAGFSKVAGEALEDEIDSSLGFLRYDYPEAVYSELRMLYRQALNEQQDLSVMAKKLANQLSDEGKVMLGVQLYDLIARAGSKSEHLVAFYSFMSDLGMAAQAIDIVYQLNASEESEAAALYSKGTSPLEMISLGADLHSDIFLKNMEPEDRLLAFRYQDLILLKNLSAAVVLVRGRPLQRGQFCRIYPGGRIIIDEQVLTYQDLAFYFNAKKGVSLPHIFVSVDSSDEVRLEKARSRDSCLEVIFGLKVNVKALKDVDARIQGHKLKAGDVRDVTLEDKIIFHDDSELSLSDLRRRARALGGRFQLKTSKSEYLVSNNPGRLHEDDILLSPGTSGEVLLKISCDYDKRIGQLEVLQADRPIVVGGIPVRNSARLHDGDTIQIDAGQVLRCNFAERLIEEERNIIRSLEVRDVSHRFRGGETALDGITFSVTRGEMICIMGSSGTGKSTLLRVLAGQLKPGSGEVLLNNKSLYENLPTLKNYISYIPQEDSFDEHLTIEENLSYAAAIRSPHLSGKDRARRIEGKLIELGLSERRDSIVGSPLQKTLSGGERKRLNIGLDMIGSSDVYLFDEPTSGLSSKDSEHVIEIIRSMSHNKIVVVTIHQPSARIFHMFHKAALVDKSGRLVFFGTPNQMLSYFAEAEHEQHFGTSMGSCPSCGATSPEFIFDVLETPLRDLSGDIIYEENHRGQLVPARKYSPDYWRDKYEAYRLIQDVRQVPMAREEMPPQIEQPVVPRQKASIRWRDEWTQLKTLVARAFMSKMRNRGNVLTTIVEAPLLAALIATVLRYSETGAYDFSSAYHIPTYLFLSLVVAMFLGLTNSADDIIRDRAVLQRERNLNVRLGYYVSAKTLTLAIFAILQCFLYVLIGNSILEIRGMFWTYLYYMVITSLSGLALGLMVSAFVNDAKTAANIVPLILIPQIILGGALIKYEEMNRNLDFLYSFHRWLDRHPAVERQRIASDLEVPLICQFMPMRWSYEALVVAQSKRNPLSFRQIQLQEQINVLAATTELSPQQEQRLDDLKDALAHLYGMGAATAAEVDRRLRQIDELIRGRATAEETLLPVQTINVTAEQLYSNQKVGELVLKAEMEQGDYREERHLNVFFGPQKKYLGITFSVFKFNFFVLVVSTFVLLWFLHLVLRRQVRGG